MSGQQRTGHPVSLERFERWQRMTFALADALKSICDGCDEPRTVAGEVLDGTSILDDDEYPRPTQAVTCGCWPFHEPYCDEMTGPVEENPMAVEIPCPTKPTPEVNKVAVLREWLLLVIEDAETLGQAKDWAQRGLDGERAPKDLPENQRLDKPAPEALIPGRITQRDPDGAVYVEFSAKGSSRFGMWFEPSQLHPCTDYPRPREAHLEDALRKIAEGEAGNEQAFEWAEFYDSIRRFARSAIEEEARNPSLAQQDDLCRVARELIDAIATPKGRDFRHAWGEACLRFGRFGDEPTLLTALRAEEREVCALIVEKQASIRRMRAQSIADDSDRADGEAQSDDIAREESAADLLEYVAARVRQRPETARRDEEKG